MGEKDEDCWVWKLGDYLTREILEEMAAIRLERQTAPAATKREMGTVCCNVDGAYQMRLLFRAEEKLFRRLAVRMIGEGPEVTEEIVQEYAKEVVNTLVGRFISEIYRMTKVPARFRPVEYKKPVEGEKQEECEPFHTIYFLSDEEEYVEFSWSREAMEELVRRSERK